MNYFKSGENRLSYKLTAPNNTLDRTCVVFVHAAEGTKLGPHRMFVELANHFNKIGLCTFRFDLSGCGDSTGVSMPNTDRDVQDIASAIDHIKNSGKINKIILLGISRGAYTIHKYITDTSIKLEGVILLSLPFSNNKTAAKTVSYRLKEYVLKLANLNTYKKALRNQIKYKLILKTILKALDQKNRYKVKTAASSKAPVLLIYGQNDPITKGAIAHYLPLLSKSHNKVECKVIEGANHSFFHYKWKQEITDITTEWLRGI